jgi:hypothetical protein
LQKAMRKSRARLSPPFIPSLLVWERTKNESAQTL